MMDEFKREKGKYVSTDEKIINSILYKITETIVIGRDYEILNFSREYSPPLKYKE